MREELRRLGLNFCSKGVEILKKLIRGEATIDSLSDKEIEAVLEDWDGRLYFSGKEKESAIDSNPKPIEGESEMDYNRRHVDKIARIIKGLINSPCA